MDFSQKPRPRTASLTFFPPLVTTPTSPLFQMAYQRNLSPGGRRINNPASASASGVLNDPYRYERHNSYASPRTSNGQISGVVPISTQTFVNVPAGQRSAGAESRFDSTYGRPAVDSYSGRPTDIYSGRPIEAYTGRPRRSSLVDNNRGQPNSSTSQLPQRRPVVQQEYRPASPQKGSRDKDFYVTPASSKEPRKTEHKKLYTVNDGSANLVADVDVPAGGERHHKRRESFNGTERGGYRTSEKDRGRRGYHLNGPSTSSRRERPVVDDEDFKYTDPAGMYNETEPAYRRPEARPRRGSVDRGGANSRERPISMIESSQDPRSSAKNLGSGPPPSYRGWDRVNEMGRANSVRERGREVPQSPHRARVPQSPTRARVPQSPTRGRYPEAGSYGDSRDPYYVPPRRNSTDRQNLSAPNERYDRYEYEDRKEPRHRGRRESVTRANDRSVERRGFGIRADSQDRFGRGSDESFEGRKYRDSGYAAVTEPHRRDTAPEVNYQEERRLEQERKDRLMAQQLQTEERERLDRDREPKRRDDDRAYDRGHDRAYERERDRPRERDNREYDLDRERELERERMLAPQPSQPSHDRHHTRQDSTYRDFPRDREPARKEPGPRESAETHAQPGLSTAAAAGLAGAAATYGATKYLSKDKDDRDKDRDSGRDRDRDSDRAHDKPRDRESDRRSPRFDAPPQERRSDEGVHHHHDRNQAPEPDRGLGFAFEGQPPQPPRSAPPTHDRSQAAPVRDEHAATGAGRERDIERDTGERPAEVQQNGVDAEEDYRRRMEQVQRELGRAPDERAADSDPDRERRRREREQRRSQRHGGGDSGIATPREMPGSFGSFPEPNGNLPHRDPDNRGYEDRKAPPRDVDNRGYDDRAPKQPSREYDDRGFDNRNFENRSFENDTVDGSAVSRPSGLSRKPSILDQPMGSRDAGQMAHIIDNSQSERRENRVRIVDPPTEEEDKKPKGILKKPTEKFPENPNVMREGVAPLKDVSGRRLQTMGPPADDRQATKKGIPPGARWTRIDRRLVNPESLEEAKERFEERQDCVIVLRVLTKEEIQKFADRTNILRGRRHRSHSVGAHDDCHHLYPHRRASDSSTLPSSSATDSAHHHHDHDEAPSPRRRHSHQHHHPSPPATSTAVLIDLIATAFPTLIPRILADDARGTEKRETERRELEERDSRHSRRNRERRERDEYEEENSEDEFKPRAPRMLEAPSSGGASAGGDAADFRERRSDRERERERERDREGSYVSGSSGKRSQRDEEYGSSGKRRDDEYDR